MLAPGGAVAWKEYWYPVHGLNTGFEFATEKVAIQTRHEENKIGISMISTERIKGLSCVLMADGKEIQRQKTDLSPTASVTLEMSKSSHDIVTVILETENGEVLAEFQSPLPLPAVEPITPASYVDKKDNALTSEEFYLKAQKFDRALDRIKARKYYNEALMVDSLHLSSLRDLAILDFEQGLYDQAESGFTKALKQIPNDDGLAWYFLGLCRLKQNDLDGAIKCGFKASKCQGTVARGYDLLGRSFLLQKKFLAAKEHFQKAYSADLNDPLLYHHFMLATYASGDKKRAIDLAIKRIAEYPTELTPRFLLIVADKNSDQNVNVIRDFVGEDDFEILEASLVFSRLGLYEEAIKILESACIKPLSSEDKNHLIQYQLACLNHLNGNDKNAVENLMNASIN